MCKGIPFGLIILFSSCKVGNRTPMTYSTDLACKNQHWKQAAWMGLLLRKSQIMEFLPSTNLNSLLCVTTVRNMDPIKLCVHRNLLIAVAIGSDIRFAGSTLNFRIFCLCFGSLIIPRIPHYVVFSTNHKLMPRDTRTSRPLLMENMRVDTYTLIIQVVFQHSQG